MNISICDLDSCAYIIGSTYHDADHNTVMQQVDSMMHSILQATQADRYIGFLGGVGNFRHSVAVTKPYKGNRSKEQPEWLQRWKTPINDHLIKEWGAVVCNGIEADDAVGILWKHYQNSEHLVTLCHNDKDTKQFSGPQYDYKKQEHLLFSEQEASYNFWYQMLIGDPTDTIPGLMGGGPKNAEKILSSSTLGLTYSEAVRQAYLQKGCTDAYYQEQYTLLKMLEEPSYGFIIPELIPYSSPDPFSDKKEYAEVVTVSKELTDNQLTLLGF